MCTSVSVRPFRDMSCQTERVSFDSKGIILNCIVCLLSVMCLTTP